VSTLKLVASAVASEMTECKERSHGLVDQCVALSEREVMAAAESVMAIKRDAQDHARSLDGLRSQFDSSDSHALSAAVEDQRKAIRNYTSSVHKGLDLQHTAACSALECAQQISWLAGKIQAFSQELAMLTLNARMESARSGQKGAAFATIADSMRALSSEVKTANGRVADLASSLNDILPTLEKQARDLRDQNNTMAEGLEVQLGGLASAFSEARSVAGAVVQSGGEHAARVVTQTGELLTRFQFQDRMSQTLRELEGVITRTDAVTCALLDSLPEDADEDTVNRALAEARSAAKNPSVRISGESELASSDALMQSGEVNFF
jgi:methyl-accepting chemotaxis protein